MGQVYSANSYREDPFPPAWPHAEPASTIPGSWVAGSPAYSKLGGGLVLRSQVAWLGEEVVAAQQWGSGSRSRKTGLITRKAGVLGQSVQGMKSIPCSRH